MNCNRRKALKEEISHDWSNLNLAAQVLVCLGCLVFAASIFIAFYKTSDNDMYKSIEVVFRTSLVSIFGFLLSSNIKNVNDKNKNKSKKNEISITVDEADCNVPENYREGNSIQIIIAFVVSVMCACSILAIYIFDMKGDLPSITMFRDLMCSATGFLLGESKIKKG